MSTINKAENKKQLEKTVRSLIADAASGDDTICPVQRISRAHAFVDCALIFKCVSLDVYDMLKKEILDSVSDQRAINDAKARTFKRSGK